MKDDFLLPRNKKIPEALEVVVKKYRQKLIDGRIPVSDLIIKKHLSKNPKHSM
jgi:hypothetical protein